MVEFSLNEIVKVARRPEPHHVNYHMSTLGFVGFIEEFRSHSGVRYAQLECLDGNGCGMVPLVCLDPEPDPKWAEAKAKREREIAARLASIQEWHESMQEARDEVAARLEMTPEQVDRVLALWDELKPEPPR